VRQRTDSARVLDAHWPGVDTVFTQRGESVAHTDRSATHFVRRTGLNLPQEFTMNEDTIEGTWKQIAGKIKQKWGKLTNDDLQRASGQREYLLGRLQEHYGLAKEKAEAELKALGYA
jgi:uncharacterized protein YjbJ (UPF0337 family)